MGARGDTEFLICLNTADGKELWATKVGDLLKNGWGDGPRSTPTVDGTLVYALGGKGKVVCAAVADGAIQWEKDFGSLGGKSPNWGYCESVLVDGDRVVCTPGGKDGAIVALNKSSGEVLWRSSDLTDGAQYASIVPWEHGGTRQYVQLFMKTLAGVSATDGKVLWKADFPGQTAVIPTPIAHDGQVYVAAGYGVGCMLVKVSPENQVEVVYENKNMKNHHGGVILLDDHLYGYSDGNGWVCQNFKSGEIVWSEKNKLGKGCIAYADGRFYLMDEKKGDVVLISASTKGWEEHGRFKLDPQTTKRSSRGAIWTHPVVCNGKLYLRDQELLSCYNVRAN
jgi:outer membrane protein assembly factor BamB